MWLSFSKYDTYLACPKKYKYQVDRITPPQKESKYFALYGILIQKFFEHYTNVYIPNKIEMTTDKIRSGLDVMWQKILRKEFVNWNDPWVKQTPSQIFEEALTDIVANIKEFDFWESIKSEVSYKIELKKTKDVLNGRIDFIRNLVDGEVEILDGKSTKHLDRVDPEQLLFYALLYYLRHKKLPKKLGFLFYRYRIIKYIDFNKDILITFNNKLALAKKAIRLDKNFEAKVKLSKVCLWCPYKSICNPYLEKKAANSNKRRKNDIDLGYDGDILSFGLNS